MNQSLTIQSKDDIFDIVDSVFVETIYHQGIKPRSLIGRRGRSARNLSNLNQMNSRKRCFDETHNQSAPSGDCQGDDYGWFIDTDIEFKGFKRKRLQENCDSDLPKTCTTKSYLSSYLAHDVSFEAITALKEKNLNTDIDWALAADIVDDVLSNCSFSTNNITCSSSENSFPI